MEDIPISRFKATCLAVLEKVRRTGQAVRITRFGKPVADVVPSGRPGRDAIQLGGMEDRFTIVGDIIAPVVGEAEWEILRDEAPAGHAHLDLVAESNRPAGGRRAGRPRKPR